MTEQTPEPVPPTQVKHPWQATVRTVFQTIVALAAALPFLVKEAGLNPDAWPWLATALVVAGVITRVMANPRVELFLQRFLGGLLSARGRSKRVG
jgi:hypothetical protein